MCRIEKILTLTVGAKAVKAEIHGLACLIQNNSETATVYFRETREDGKSATAANGWALLPGSETQIPMTALDLSLIASEEGADVRILVLDY